MNRKILFIAVLILASLVCLSAKNLPVDSNVKIGKLENGLTYYICSNKQIKGVANFYLACNVGAIAEEDHENGLAHFLEHMAFQGTENFEGREIINSLELLGVKFGENLNASTYRDKTIYQITDVPLTNEEVMDNCLLILHDWIGGISLEEEAIDKEREVIREEMRQANAVGFRKVQQLFYDQLMPAHIYGRRNVLGIEDVIMNFQPEVLRTFYEKWYRPDLTAIIVVGDIGVKETELKVKKLFSTIPVPNTAPAQINIEMGENEEPLIAIAADKEMPYSMAAIEYRHSAVSKEKRGSVDEVMMDYIHNVGVIMLQRRLQETMEDISSPYYEALADNDSYMHTATTEAFMGIVAIKGEEYENATKSLFREIERIRRFGFSDLEYEEAKKELLVIVENQVNDNNSYAEKCVEHFLTGTYLVDSKMEYSVYESLTEQLPLDVLNEYYTELLSKENRVLKMTIAEAENSLLPVKEQCANWLLDVENEMLVAYKRERNDKPLMQEIPKGGEIVDEIFDDLFGATVLTLANGAKVVIKQTDYQRDKVEMRAVSIGGSSHFPENEPVNIALYDELSNIGGLGDFSNKDLKSMLAGKDVEVTPFINTISEGFVGTSSARDFETMLQLIYLHFTAPRKDEEACLTFIERKKAMLGNQKNDLFSAISDSLRNTVYENKARHLLLQENDLPKINYDTIMNWRKDRYADASDFTFVFSGDISIEQVKPLITQYLGTLPACNRSESYKEVNDGYRTGRICNKFSRDMEDPRSISVSIYSTIIGYNISDVIKTNMLALILNSIYTEKVRMQDGSVYSISAETTIKEYPFGLLQLQITFMSDPAKEEYINRKIYDEFVTVAKEGIDKELSTKAKEFLLKKQKGKEQQNDYWTQVISDYYVTGYNAYSDYTITLENISIDDIKEIASRILETGNKIDVILSN